MDAYKYSFRHDTLADPVMVEITSGDYYHLWAINMQHTFVYK